MAPSGLTKPPLRTPNTPHGKAATTIFDGNNLKTACFRCSGLLGPNRDYQGPPTVGQPQPGLARSPRARRGPPFGEAHRSCTQRNLLHAMALPNKTPPTPNVCDVSRTQVCANLRASHPHTPYVNSTSKHCTCSKWSAVRTTGSRWSWHNKTNHASCGLRPTATERSSESGQYRRGCGGSQRSPMSE